MTEQQLFERWQYDVHPEDGDAMIVDASGFIVAELRVTDGGAEALARHIVRLHNAHQPVAPDARKELACVHCGSTDILIDAYALWNPETGQAELHSVFDNWVCQGCDDQDAMITERSIAQGVEA
jgi:hypothetical protein